MIAIAADGTNQLYPDLKVYAFDGSSYTGFNKTTDANGQATFTLPQGSYRFRADYDGVQFWSSAENHCALPGCESAAITLPGGYQYAEVTIDYTYDPLYRLTAADYDNGDYYHYAYDAVGNRLTQESMVSGLTSTNTYAYDTANRLVDVDGIPYTWDANGNLLNDGVNTYTYDSANRLVEVSHQSTVSSYQYNGLGDRLSQNGAQYTLDLNSGLTQVLSDGATSYTYGLGRISQQAGSTAEYFLGDALGSVRQLTDQSGAVTFAQGYDPYGVVTLTKGAGQSAYGFTGEQQGASGLVYLRARYYGPADGRFTTRDTWNGDARQPLSYNLWNYGHSNPIIFVDPTGHWRCFSDSERLATAERYVQKGDVLNTYTAAGIAVQCRGSDVPRPGDEGNSGIGIAQISDNQAETPYGEIVVGNRGSGLRCYIRGPVSTKPSGLGYCAVCLTKKQLEEMDEEERELYHLEETHDQSDPTWAVIYMRRRIKLVYDACKNSFCNDKDKFIVSALAQNGPGFTTRNVSELHNTYFNGYENLIDWQDWWQHRSIDSKREYSVQLRLFYKFVKKLNRDGYYLPSNILNDNDIQWIMGFHYN